MKKSLDLSLVPEPGEADDIHFLAVEASLCMYCGRCEDLCPTGAIQTTVPGVKWALHHIPDPHACVACGQCLLNCPGQAIQEQVSFLDTVKAMVADPQITTVAMTSPSIRYVIGESFGDAESVYRPGKMFSALRQLGFDKIWDVEFAADVTIMEESSELLARLNGTLEHPLPSITSCCPGWIRYAETYYPELIPHLSTARSPGQMMGALAKTYGASQAGVRADQIFTVQIMPCIAKKFEGLRIENCRSGYRDVDATLNTRELIEWMNSESVNFQSLPEGAADPPFQTSTGAATIFGATGGVMEAALRRVVEELNGQPLTNVDFTSVRGTENVREATLTAGGQELQIAVVSGLQSVRDICNEIVQGNSPYAAIEVMACPGGCLNGGGQPIFS